MGPGLRRFVITGRGTFSAGIAHVARFARHLGLLANRQRKDNLALCRRLIAARTDGTRVMEVSSHAQIEEPSTLDDRCPRWALGHMVIFAEVTPSRAGPTLPKGAFCHA